MELNVGQRLALNIDMHTILDAGAGTGKTQSIVKRVIEHYLSIDQRATRLLPAGPRPAPLSSGALRIGLSEREDLSSWQGLLPSEVVVLTFTTRAADEMRHRLWSELNRLRPGPTRDDGDTRRDSRVTQEGLIDQLTAMLEDAPIGTIDSFLARLVAPWRADLSERPTDDVVSAAEQHVLINRTLDLLWRLRSTTDAIEAGVDGDRASDLINARNRLSRRFGTRNSMRKVLSAFLSNRVFVDTVARRMENSQTVSSDDVKDLIVNLLEPMSIIFDTFIDEIHTACQRWLNHARNHAEKLDLRAGLVGNTRFQALVELIDSGPPATVWERWLWLHALCIVTATITSSQKRECSAFSGGNLISNTAWPRGIETWGKVKDPDAKKDAKILGASIARIWSSEEGFTVRTIARIIHLLDDDSTVPYEPPNYPLTPIRLSSPLPLTPPDGLRTFGIEEEASNINDLLLCHRSLLDMFHELKVHEGVHEFDDVAMLAGDLLLAQCPKIMRRRYPTEVVHALDALPVDVWRDDHIHAALNLMEGFRHDPKSAALTSEEANFLHDDLLNRYHRLRDIRARYRAFIVDEAQDNSAQQWRILGRLWGERNMPEGREHPDTSWGPTICCVGDRKQSIYAFRQAQVSGFVNFSRNLRIINVHEFNSLPELTRSPELRRVHEARDPRYVSDGGFHTAAEMPASRGLAEGAWVRFDASQDGLPVDSVTAKARAEGHVELVVNYRTAGNLLERLNGWWIDLFSSRYDRFPGDWYARPQALLPNRNTDIGQFEWLLPAKTPSSNHPDPDLLNSLDPFIHGTSAEMENALIAARIRALIDGAPTRIGNNECPPSPQLLPSEILVLLPSRSNLDDLMKRLEAAGIPAQADKEGGLLRRPVVTPLLSLLEWLARPTSRHAAAAVSRSCLVGLDDGVLQTFLGDSTLGENLISRLKTMLPEGPHRELVEMWNRYAERGDAVGALHSTIDHSDLLLGHPRISERQEAEQFVQLVESQLSEVGGDAVLLADRISHLANVAGNNLTTESASTSDAVQVMTIHGSKGLQARCVIVGGLFSEGQGNIRHDLRDRVLATPEIFAANPNPWLTGAKIESGVWTFAKMLQEAQIQAEARRLFYVACTRVKDILILAGSPNDSVWEGDAISLKPRPLSMPTFGHMWFETQGWEPDDDGRYRTCVPLELAEFPIHSHVSELGDMHSTRSPLVRMHRLHQTTTDAFEEVSHTISTDVPNRQRLSRIAPHALDAAASCPRRHWLSTRTGLSTEAIRLDMAADHLTDTTASRVGLPPANVIGSIVHRLMEVGLANPGPSSALTAPLSEQWTQTSTDLLTDTSTLAQVISELLPADADADAMTTLMIQMSELLRKGPLGTLTRGEAWNDEIVEGLRTEWPFSIRHTIPVDTNDETWAPHGSQSLAEINSFEISSSGIADLVLCTRLESGEGAIRAVDLKTTGAAHLHAGRPHPLLEADGPSRHHEESALLEKYRMQLALYTRVLILQEESRKAVGIQHRRVLPPAILATSTGRMITMSDDEMTTALDDLDNLFKQIAELALRPGDADLPPRLSGEAAEACHHCPFSMGDIRLCAPEGEPLGLRPIEESE
ncbi:MAG: UvrD-helicase domain-containing protein [Candidatus Thalassarchaeaceae archaeon]|nr:UvrD-helicase domain-containing protein [Candidatus Thalassarchaeaceae archaeon]